MNKKQITYLIIFIAVFLIAIAGATYAFFEFGGVTIDGNLPINTATGSSATFTAYSEGNITLDVNKTVMSKDISSNVAASTDNSTIHVKLEGGSGTSSTTCTYDLIWAWDSTEQYKTSTVELPYTHTDGTKYPYEFSVKIGANETNLSDFTWNENKAIIATKSISAVSGETKTDDYDVIVNFYNLPIRQNDLSGKLYQGHIEVSEARCNANPTIAVVAKEGDNLSSSIKKLYTEQGVDVGNGKLYLHDSSLENSAEDGSYRYAGADPDNYICFEGDTCDDDHKYRIIGIFGENIKVIKMTSVGDKVWNSSNVNTWDGSTMDTYLNGEWLTSFGHQDLIEDYDWHVGGMADADIQGSNNVKHTLDAEMASSPVVTRKVGLMYASDYGYAAENTYWTKDLYDYEPSKGHDWMLTSANYEWTISRSSGHSNFAFIVYSSRCDGYYYDVRVSNASRPSFYLKSSVVYKGGTGTSGDPIIVTAGPTAVDTIKANYTGQGSAAGENGVMYLHDSTLENSANDGSYRYAGADPDNYLCFEGDTCDDDHKYRIIGIFGENLKVIKMTSVGNKSWNSSGSNTWDGSTMDTYLNNEWLTSFGHSDLIEDYDWHVGGYNNFSVTPKVMYDAEMNSTPTVTRKVGLMYASDYGYAATNNHWGTSLYSYEPSKGHDWMLTSASYEWTISRYSSLSDIALTVDSSGLVIGNGSVRNSNASRPSFYLKSSVEIKSGSGSKTDPWIMG